MPGLVWDILTRGEFGKKFPPSPSPFRSVSFNGRYMSLLPDQTPWVAPENVTIYGLGYKKNSGKDTVGEMMTKMTTVGTQEYVVSFAEALKEACIAIFDLDPEQVYTQEGKEVVDSRWGVTPRQLLQWVGTDCIRNVLHPDIWVMSVRNSIMKAAEETRFPLLVVIPDVRFPNEAEAIHSWGGKVWNIVRPHEVEENPHVSETALDGWDDWDEVIYNDGTLEELEAKVRDLFVQ